MNIIRIILGLILCVFIAMTYWSSVLLEQDLKYAQGDLLLIRNDLQIIKGEFAKLRSDLQKFSMNSPKSFSGLQVAQASSKSENNLLTPDPFYEKTIPHMLGLNFTPKGIRKEAEIGKPNNLHPFNSWYHIASWISLCSVSLAGQELGIYETLTPDMALSMELRHAEEKNPEYWLKLREDIYWQPLNPRHFSQQIHLAPQFLQKHRVTAHDVKFYFDAIMNPYVEQELAVTLRSFYSDIEDVQVIDDFTLVVRWKTKSTHNAEGQEIHQMKYLAKSLTGSLRPLPRFVYQYFSDGTKIIEDDSDPNTYRTNPIWAQNFSHHWANNIIVSCGPWLFDGMTEREIRFKRNPEFYDPYAVLVDAYEVKFRDSPDAIWTDFKLGTLDRCPVLPNQLAELEQFMQSAPYQKQVREGNAIKRLDYLSRSYSYIGWNQINPLFKSKKVRQALTMAIDRERIIRQNLNGQGIQTTGTFFPYSPSYDPSLTPYPYDPDRARQLLQEEGWYDRNGDGIIDQVINGQTIPFRFTLTYFVKNPISKSTCEFVATVLKNIGIECTPNGVDIADLSAAFENKAFDAITMAWALGTPPEDPKQLWYSAGVNEKGSANMISFSNHEADEIIDQLEYEADPQKRIELYHRFDKIIYEEAPYTFLYVPKTTMIYRDYLKNVFIPADRQDLIPGANVGEPVPAIFWINQPN